MKKRFSLFLVLLVLSSLLMLQFSAAVAQDSVTITIAVVNNPDQRRLLTLSDQFHAAYPNINLSFVMLPENELRARVTTDITTGAGSFDVVQIGTFETPIFAKNQWLASLDDLMAQYPDNVQPDYDVQDLLEAVRLGLSYEGELYAVPFYAESSMTFYNKAMFAEAGLEMPEQPTWDQIREFACALHDPANDRYGIALRGLPGWGEVLAPLNTVVNTYGARWFDENWQPQLNTPEFKEAVNFYVNLVRDCGVPGAANNGFSESLTMMAQGKAAMWVDATVAAGFLTDPEQSQIVDDVGFAMAPVGPVAKGYHWLWSWAYAIPSTSQHQAAALQFLTWCTSKDYITLVGETYGWQTVPPGTRVSTYENPKYQEAAGAFANLTRQLIETADPTDQTRDPVPYVGVQFVGIPEFQGFGTDVSQQISAAIAGQITVDEALTRGQDIVERAMRDAGYIQ
ncbi:MAG: sugar ABC transporter substrate-binding protein [Anaerolineae bacterium]|nr:sugar ABC transporter substrate-binding protein [Anaerolineae bacterium]